MLAPDGSINENGAPFTGMMRYDARIAVEEALEEKVRNGINFNGAPRF
jgi:valyl-tRNA synthetase